jgi:hypothetical protein
MPLKPCERPVADAVSLRSILGYGPGHDSPGVRLPGCSVTRLTATTLAETAWGNRRCRARTFPHLPACVACTRRPWSRRTIVWALGPWMACPAPSWRETAPAGVATAVLCFVSWLGSPRSRVRQDPHGQSARVRVEECGAWLNASPPSYRMAFAASRVPYPPPHRLAFRLTFPGGRETG